MNKKNALISRRRWLKTSLAACSAFTIVPRHVLGGPGYRAPSEQLTKGIVGVGSMGRGHRELEGTRLLAVCDVDTDHIAQALKGYPDAQGYRDFRELIARPDIDIVHIATPEHWHALISIAAMQAGKDVWCEKPMTRTMGEGQRVVDVARRTGRMFRINTWFRFRGDFYGFGVPVRTIKKVVENRLLGWPLKVTVGAGQGFNWKHLWCGNPNLKPAVVPQNLDYDFWLGPAPWKPYNPDHVHLKFRGFWDYGGGGLGDMGMHYLDPVQYLLEKDHTSPIEVEADAPPQHSYAVGTWRRICLKYADGCEVVLDGNASLQDAPFIEGPKGKLFKGMQSTIPNLPNILRELPEPAPQITHFSESVRTRRKFALNEENAFRSCTMVNLAIAALRLGRPLRFDPDKLEFIGDAEANRQIHQPMRAPWSV